ncbi:hypothetical protein UFOVP1040_10 [uncultured Caudovirales phage]|uniref:Uncharacterized protein n=1 Tax=uncultured Caudovirales phage TaxID=2100421 RepID=A0A6J5QEN1_9CAUD|nr:hypothetical protein UFOVP1040_10 [uncultured Caudovirales phage]
MTTEINKLLLTKIRAEIDAAMKPLAAKYGLTSLALGKGTYDPRAGRFTFKLEGIAEGGKTKEAVMYEQCAFLELPPLGTTFAAQGREYTTVGLNTTGTKVHTTCSFDGRTYLFKTEDVKRLCKTQAAKKAA